MRIVHIESGRHLYGGGRQVRYLVDGLAARGAANVLICARGGELAAAPPAADIVPVDIGGDLDVRAFGRLRRVLKSLKPDLVHVHSRRGAELFGGLASAFEARPAVLTRRVDSPEPKFWARLKYRPYAAIVALSAAIERELITAGVAAAIVHRIPSAVDAHQYRPDTGARARALSAFGLPSDAFVVGVVAQLIARKRHGWLLALLPKLVARHPEIRVLCFGRGPLARALAEEVRALDLAAHVQFAGFRDDLAGLVPGFDVLAHPADREGLGAALLEAAASGVPVVACRAGGVVDVVRHERTGLLAAPADPAAFAAALERLLSDSGERRRFGAAARADVEARFTVDSLVTAHERLYTAVLSGQRMPASHTARVADRGAGE